LSQSEPFKTKKQRIPKQLAYYDLFINGFNAKLQRHIAMVKGLNNISTDKSQTTPINTLLNRVALNT